jgi:hypothetical protein
MLKIGVALKDLSPSERNFMFMAQLSEKTTKPDVDCRIFYQNLEPTCVNPLNCALMPLAEMFGFQDGILITTDIDTTLFAINAPISSKIIFYVDDIEWMRGNNNYLQNIKVYQSKYCSVICKSADYSRYLNNYANISTPVVEHYNLEGILKNGYYKNNSIVR